MRVRTLGRWVGRMAAVTALGTGAVLGTPVIALADEMGTGGTATVDEVPAESPDDAASTDSFEWN